MKVVTLASSSKGNCTLVYNENSMILIDMGITLSTLEQKFQVLNLNVSDIDAVLITHDHSDHTKGLQTLQRKYRTPVFCHSDSLDAVMGKINNADYTLFYQFSCIPFKIKDFVIDSFKIPHDVVCCLGYNIFENNNKITYLTDLGHITDEIIERLYNSKLVILESNHDENMLLNNPKYSMVLKRRILGKNGHLSNATASKVIEKLAQNNVTQVLLAHLSEENNTPELCYETISKYLISEGIIPNVNIKIAIAKPYNISPVFIIK